MPAIITGGGYGIAGAMVLYTENDIRARNGVYADLSVLYDDIMKRTDNGVEMLFKMDYMAVGFKVKYYWYQIGHGDFLHSFFSPDKVIWDIEIKSV